MYSSILVLLLMICGICVCAECQMYHASKRGLSSRFEEDESSQPHKFEMDSCDGHFEKSFGIVNMKSKCTEPVDTMVPLIHHSEYISYTPSKVRVKRCQGMCSTQLECVATHRHTRELSVRQRDERMGHTLCVTVSVEEHLTCKCVCSLMKKHCNPKLQMYDAEQCMCVCMDPQAKKRCVSQGFKWDDPNCSCTCHSDKGCTTGEVWDHTECMCVPEVENDTIYDDDSNDI